MDELVDSIVQAVDRCIRSPLEPLDLWVRPYAAPPEEAFNGNQFVVMLKPELTVPATGASPTAALTRVLAILAEHGVQLGATRVLSSVYLAQHKVIEWHYAMLHKVSQRGLAAISAAARLQLIERFPHALDGPEPRVLGGHEFLARFPQFTPYTLDVLTRNLQVVKLGAGTYSIDVLLDGERWLVLNAFRPAQLEHFTTPGRAVVLIECRDTRHLSDIRRTTIGATDPRDAVPGSIKHTLLKEQLRLGLRGISTRLNAVHMSPGPVEAMFGVQRYFGPGMGLLPLAQTVFGAGLLEEGFQEEEIQALESNPEIRLPSLAGPLFEVTEDLNWDEALPVVTGMLRPVTV